MFDKIQDFIARQEVEFNAFYDELAKTYTPHKTLQEGDILLYRGDIYRVLENIGGNVKLKDLRTGAESYYFENSLIKRQG